MMIMVMMVIVGMVFVLFLRVLLIYVLIAHLVVMIVVRYVVMVVPMVFPLSFAFLPNPMRMRDTDRMQNPVEYQKRENRHDEDQRHQLVIGFRIRVCLR